MVSASSTHVLTLDDERRWKAVSVFHHVPDVKCPHDYRTCVAEACEEVGADGRVDSERVFSVVLVGHGNADRVVAAVLELAVEEEDGLAVEDGEGVHGGWVEGADGKGSGRVNFFVADPAVKVIDSSCAGLSVPSFLRPTAWRRETMEAVCVLLPDSVSAGRCKTGRIPSTRLRSLPGQVGVGTGLLLRDKLEINILPLPRLCIRTE